MKTLLLRIVIASSFAAFAFTGTANGPGNSDRTISIAASITQPESLWETDWVFPIQPESENEETLDGVLIEGMLPDSTRHATEEELLRFAARYGHLIEWSNPANPDFPFGLVASASPRKFLGSSFEKGLSFPVYGPRDPGKPGVEVTPRFGTVDVVSIGGYVGAPKTVERRTPYRLVELAVRPRRAAILAANPER
jgi:hypothetical protein